VADQRRGTAVDAPGAPTLDHSGLMVEAGEAGLGIAFVPEPFARRATLTLETEASTKNP
jgi:DNA-binding transcriptional LysR family regulator